MYALCRVAAYLSTSLLTIELLSWIDCRTRSLRGDDRGVKDVLALDSPFLDHGAIDGLVPIDRCSGQGAIVVLMARRAHSSGEPAKRSTQIGL